MSKTRLTDQQIVTALKAACGQVYLAAEKLGCRPEAILRRMARSPQVAAVVESFRGKLVDTAEAALYRAVLAGESWAVRFALSTQGQARGYGERESDGGRQSFLEKSGASVQEVLRTLIENDDFVEFCRHQQRPALVESPQ